MIQNVVSATQRTALRLALPKGSMQSGVDQLLADAGIRIREGARSYRPTVSMEGVQAKRLKPQNVVEMLAAGSRDVGFAGADWVAELGADLVEVLDTGLDPVRLVAAAPAGLDLNGPLVIASEYERITRNWIAERGLDARFLRSYGATEVFPPEDADCIVDNTATGATLEANGLDIVDTLMTSSTRLYANPKAMADARRGPIEDLALVLRAVLEARSRVLVEVNVGAADLDAVVAVLPCMREPTVSPLLGDAGFAVKAAVPRQQLFALIPRIREAGGTDVLVSALSQIVV